MSPWVRQNQVDAPSTTKLRAGYFALLIAGLLSFVLLFMKSSRFTYDKHALLNACLATLYLQTLFWSRLPRPKLMSAGLGSAAGYSVFVLLGPLLEMVFRSLYASPKDLAATSSSIPWWARLSIWFVLAALIALLDQKIAARRQHA